MVDCSAQGAGVVSARIRVPVPSMTPCRRIRRFHEGRGPSPGSGSAAAQRWAAPCPAAMEAGGDELDCLERLDDELLGSHGGQFGCLGRLGGGLDVAQWMPHGGGSDDEAEDDDALIPLHPDDSSSRQLQGSSHQGQLQSRHRKTSRTQDTVQWEAIVEDASREEFEAKLAATVAVEIAPATEWGHGIWRPSATGFSSLGLRRRELRCPFRGPANACCNAVLRETVDEHGRYTLERKRGVPHADHSISNKKRGLSKLLKLTVAEPARQGHRSGVVIKAVREKMGAISKVERAQIVRERSHVRRKQQDAIVPREQRNEFGGMVVLASKRTRAALLAADEFGAHTAYVIGETEVDSEQQRITITYSTENLLLNAYRQSQYGFPQIVQVDCTSRLVLEGHSCMLFGCVDAGQHFHPIGYGVCAKEDQAAHVKVFRNLKNEVERVVAQRTEDQEPI